MMVSTIHFGNLKYIEKHFGDQNLTLWRGGKTAPYCATYYNNNDNSILVKSLEIISTFQDDCLHDTANNIHHRENYRNQESRKSTKSFSEEIQVCCTFKKSYSAVPQKLLQNRKLPHIG